MSGSKTITNPNGAFGATGLGAKLPQVTGEFVAGAAISASIPVAISSTGTISTMATDGVGFVGVTLNAIASGKTGTVVVLGIAQGVRAGGATTLGTPVIRSATTAGYVTSSATPVNGTVVGYALGASSGGLVDVWVLPGSLSAS